MSLFFSAWLLLLYYCRKSFAQLPVSEYNALYDLYNATNGAEWVWSDDPQQDGIQWSFVPEADPCLDHWQGVTCSATYHVASLELPRMHLAGTLPTTLSYLVEMQVLELSFNALFGGLPSAICSLVYLEELALEENKLTGSIPSCIGNLTAMRTMYLFRNRLDGPIPAGIADMSQLEYLFLTNNRLTGSIPPSLTSLGNLLMLRVDKNTLTGPIPETIGQMSKLIVLYLDQNPLSGTIPTSIGDLSVLVELSVFANKLSGQIPDSIGQLTKLELLYLSHNDFTGTIPPSFGNLGALLSLLLMENGLTGPVPNELGKLSKLELFYAEDNALTGTLPQSIGNLSSLLYFSFDYNRLTGSIPTSIGQLTKLQFLYLFNNRLTGTIPESLGRCTKIQNLKFDTNMLTGPIPSSFSNITGLITLGLRQNRLTGNLDNVFSAAQTSIQTIELDDNQFTGTLPSTLFELPIMNSLSIVGSCIHGTLPDNICQAMQLEALILYGLTTGQSCRASGLQALQYSKTAFHGKFPTCLLGLPNLVTLLLSSNGLTGSVPSDAVVSAKLLELDLSHNSLSGSIPNVIQNHTWSLLDLSHNKLSGVLNKNLLLIRNVTDPVPVNVLKGNGTANLSATTFVPDPRIELSSNRLSGPVPSALMPLHNNLSVLAGNLFECKYDKSNLPQHDGDEGTYECASNTFDIAIYVWLGIAVSMLVTLCIVYYRGCLQRFLSPTPDDWQPELSATISNVHQLLTRFDTLRTVARCCGAFCLIVLMPYYVIISLYAGTHTHQYAYVLSAIYTSGMAVFVCDVLLLMVLLTAMYGCFQMFTPTTTTTTTTTLMQSAAVPSTRRTRLARNLVWVVFTAINITVVLGANIAFVYVVLYQSSQLQTLMQVLLSLFKIGWSSLAAPFLIRRLDVYFLPNGDDAHAKEPFFVLQLLVALFNNIAIPCLVVAAIDPNCFSDILIPPASETVEYLLPACNYADAGESCAVSIYIRTSLEFTPPFTYGYQCSASFITSYAPTFIYMSMSTVLLTPLLQYVLLLLHQRLPQGSTPRRVVLAMVPRILKPPTPETLPATATDRRKFPIVGSVGLLVTLLTQLGILLTFGAIFPPVALAMTVSIAALVFMIRYKVERFVHAVVETQRLSFLDIINAECERVGTWEQMRVAVVIIICYCCAFYTMFLFDTLGDTVGFYASAWVLIVVPLTPPAVFGSIEMYRRYMRSLAAVKERDPSEAPSGVQLSVVVGHGIDKDGLDLSGIVSVLHEPNV